MDAGNYVIGEPLSEIRTMKKHDVRSSSVDGDRNDVVTMIEWGWSDDQIQEMLPHVEKGSITAYRAHVTRGTYEPGDIQWNPELMKSNSRDSKS